MNRKYRALLEHGRTDSRRHPPMPNCERAAQFAPFSALNGYEDAVAETARLTEAQTELSESAAEELDEKLRSLLELLPERPEITVCYFEPDARKAGGAYRRKNGRLRQLDTVARVLRFDDGSCVPLDRVRELASERF